MKALTDHKESSMLMDLSVVHENRDINEMLYLLNHSIEVKHIISFLYTNSRNEENLECKRNIRSKCREYLNGSIIEEYDNGDFRYEFEVPAEEQFWYGVVLSFGKDAKVISPYEVIEKIKNTFNEVMELYGE